MAKKGTTANSGSKSSSGSDLVPIEVTETFLHGAVRYEEGESRKVTPEERDYFVGHGWAKDPEGEVQQGTLNDGPIDQDGVLPEGTDPRTLFVDDMTHDHESEVQ